MRLHKKYIFVILIFLIQVASAQKEENIQFSHLENKSFLTIDLLSSLNVFSPRYKVGYIKNINSKWKIGINLGYGNKDISFTHSLSHFEDNFRIWEIRPEIYKILKRKDKTINYISTELYYINHQDVFHNRYYYPIKGGEISYDQTDYLREKYGFNINLGKFINYRKNLKINLYSGIGLRMRNVTFNNVINPRNTVTFVDMFDFNQYKEKEGLDFGLSYSLGLKLLF